MLIKLRNVRPLTKSEQFSRCNFENFLHFEVSLIAKKYQKIKFTELPFHRD